MNGAKAWKVLRHETAFAAKRITRKQTVPAFESLIKTNRGLIGDVVFVPHVEIVVPVRAAANYLRNSHHGHAAAIHSHIHVWTRNILTEEQLSLRIDQVLRNNVPLKWIANYLGIAGADRFRRIKGRVRMRAERVVDGDASHPEITVDFVRCGYRLNHRVGLCMPQSFIVEKEEAFVSRDGTTERSTEIISHQMIRRVHLIKSARVQSVVAQKLIGRSMKIVRAGARRDIDLAAARAAHLGRVTSCHDQKFPNAVRGRA